MSIYNELTITTLLQSNTAGKVMGVTDFVNPKDLTKPVHQVLYQFHNTRNDQSLYK